MTKEYLVALTVALLAAGTVSHLGGATASAVNGHVQAERIAQGSRGAGVTSRRAWSAVGSADVSGAVSAEAGAARWLLAAKRAALAPVEAVRAWRLPALVPARDVAAVDAAFARWRAAGHEVRRLGRDGERWIDEVRLPATADERLRVLVLGGLHGNEPNGVGAAVRFTDDWQRRRWLRRHVSVSVVPLASPENFAAGRRSSWADGAKVDPNRVFGEGAVLASVEALEAALRDFAPDVVIDLHGSKTMNGHGAIVADASEVVARGMARAEARGVTLHEGVVTRADGSVRYHPLADGVVRSGNRGTLKDYALGMGARVATSLEAPSARLPYERLVREQALAARMLVREALRLLGARS